MIYISGLIYVIAFLILGFSLRFGFIMITKNKNQSTVNLDFFTHSFFQGVLCLILLLNCIQFIGLTNLAIQIICVLFFCTALVLVIKGYTSLPFKITKPDYSKLIILFVTFLSTLLIYFNGAHLPNIAWDSWAVWEGRANQWINHGLHTNIMASQAWLVSADSLYNKSANYPEGLSLIYFVPKLFFKTAFQTTHFLYLFAYGLTVLMLQNHIRKLGATFSLQLLLVLIAFTLPLMSNHLMITGYADIWIAMILVLVILSYIDFSTQPTKAALFTLSGYVCLLPMFKLEGWVWLMLLLIAHLVSLVKESKRLKAILLSLFTVFFIATIIGVDLSTPLGQIIISSERINIFSLIDSQIEFNNISGLLMSGLFWQNNWSLIWLGLPFLLVSFIKVKQDKTSNTIHLFFTLSILSFLFLFYFTKASQWAEDFTAVNRIVLQLTPCYLLLLFRMLTQFQLANNEKHQSPKEH